MSTISMPTTLKYDKINSYLQEITEFAIQKQPKYLRTVMQFIDLNDACTIEYKSQKQLTTIAKRHNKRLSSTCICSTVYTCLCICVHVFFLNCVHIIAFNNVNLCLLKHIKKIRNTHISLFYYLSIVPKT